jgi:uncharacterized protein DUF222
MSSLHSALDELDSEDLSSVSNEALQADVVELTRAADRIAAQRLRRLAEIDRRRSYRHEGHLSTAAWMIDKLRVNSSQAALQVKMASALEAMPRTREAMASGGLSCDAVRVLASARDAHPAQFQQAEATLVQAASTLPARELSHALAYWRQAQDLKTALEDGERLRGRRNLSVRTVASGMVRVDGDLDPETGETVITALRAVIDTEAKSGTAADGRTQVQKRADALGDLCRHWLDSADRPTVGGERAHLGVIVDLEALQGKAGHRSELDHVGPIHPEMARRLACDASVSRVITRGSSEPLDIGRRTPVVLAGMRRAVV